MAGGDDLLIAEFRSGGDDAVRAVYRRYGGAVATVARSMVGQPELVEEVVQQTFLNAWRAAATFDESRDLAPWLYAIARRTAIDVLRRERKPTTGDHEPEVDVAVTTLSFEQTFESFEVRRAIDGLSSEERAVVELSHRYGLTHPEIADRLGVPVGTVKSRSARAHRRLAAALGHLAPIANRSGTPTVEGGKEQP
jgi:RNA polymerase sigma-70 factor (ECF subfamily)